MIRTNRVTLALVAAASLAIAIPCATSFGAAAPAAAAAATSNGQRRALNNNLPEMKFDGATLADALDFVRDSTAANLHVNWRALEAIGIGKDTPINLRLHGVTLRKVLNTLLSESGQGQLAWYVDQGVIEITTKELADKDMLTRIYPVEDLLVEVPDFTNAPSFDLSSNNDSNRGSGGGGGERGGGGSGSSSSVFGQGGGSGSGSKSDEKTMTRAERAEQLLDLIRTTIQPEIWKENGGTASIRFYNGSLVVTAPRSVHEALGGAVN